MKTLFSSRLLLLVLQSLLKQHSRIFYSFSTHSVRLPLTAGFLWIYLWSGKPFWLQKRKSFCYKGEMFNITWDKGVASPSDHHDEMFWSIARYCANVTGHSLRSTWPDSPLQHPFEDGVDEGWLRLTATQMCQELVMSEKTTSGSGSHYRAFFWPITAQGQHCHRFIAQTEEEEDTWCRIGIYLQNVSQLRPNWIPLASSESSESVCELIGFLFTGDNDSSDYSTQEVDQPHMNQNRKRHLSSWLLSPGNTGGMEKEKPVDH